MTNRKTKARTGRSAAAPPALSQNAAAIASDLLATEATQITRTLVNKAIDGDLTALRLCVERLVPISRERALPVCIPAPEDALQITIALKAVFTGLSAGQITPGEAHKLAAILENQRKAIETLDIEDRLIALESAPPKKVDSSHIPKDLSTLPRDFGLEDPDTNE